MNTLAVPAKYRRCLVFGGGGFRLGYYLGVHAAAEQRGCVPDVLLASCGGALAAAVIAALPDARSRCDWMASPAMYAWLRQFRPGQATALSACGGAARRWLSRIPVTRIPDLWRDYLFETPAALPLPPGAPPAAAPALVMVGARLLFAPHEARTPRAGRHLFAQVALGSPHALHLLRGMPAPSADARWSCGAIAPQLETDAAINAPDAVRISTADPFYFRSHAHGDHHYTGGIIDLFPIELAHRLAERVWMERKAPFNRALALPALRAVFGIDGAVRLRHVHAQHADAWFDTSGVARALRAHGIGKRIAWRRNCVTLALPATHAAFAAQVHAQWEFGYRCGLAAMAP